MTALIYKQLSTKDIIQSVPLRDMITKSGSKLNHSE